MKVVHVFCVVIVFAALFYSCSGGNVAMNIGATQSIDTLEDELGRNDATVPTVEQYQEARQSFLERMGDVLNEQELQAGSSVGKIKNIVAIAGITVGLAGTIAGLIVSNADTKATILQVSSAVGGVSGVLGLLPLGSEPRGAGSIQKYLRMEISRFEARWPVNLEKPLTQMEWKQFVLDAKQMERIVEALGE